jgi:hypothetical protein
MLSRNFGSVTVPTYRFTQGQKQKRCPTAKTRSGGRKRKGEEEKGLREGGREVGGREEKGKDGKRERTGDERKRERELKGLRKGLSEKCLLASLTPLGRLVSTYFICQKMRGAGRAAGRKQRLFLALKDARVEREPRALF